MKNFFIQWEFTMFRKIKLLIKKILPASKNQVNVKFDLLNKSIQKISDHLNKNEKKMQKLLDMYTTLNDNYEQQKSELAVLKNYAMQFDEDLKSSLSLSDDSIKISHDISDSISKYKTVIENQVETVRNEVIQTKRASKEAVWGEIFRDSIKESDWLLHQCFYPGRWAVGYQYLYVLYRILNSVKPQQILELGLGQSTTMITQYADSSETVKHRVIEHDVEWIEYYQQEFKVSDRTEIVNLEIKKILFKSEYELFHYENFKERLGDMKYDFISVDAPFGGAENEYSRVDILDILPECLSSSFVIMIDDVNRKGEQNTIKLIENVLTENGITFATGKYVGDKDTYVIASQDKKFVCTL